MAAGNTDTFGYVAYIQIKSNYIEDSSAGQSISSSVDLNRSFSIGAKSTYYAEYTLNSTDTGPLFFIQAIEFGFSDAPGDSLSSIAEFSDTYPGSSILATGIFSNDFIVNKFGFRSSEGLLRGFFTSHNPVVVVATGV